MGVKILTAKEAINLIKDQDTIATGGFVSIGIPEELEIELENRYLETASPKNLTLYYAAGQGDGKETSLNRLAHEGLLKRVVGGHWNMAPKIQKLSFENKIEAYNLPQGTISHMFRDAGAKRPVTLTRVGIDTFVDPDVDGGKINDITKEDIVHKVCVKGHELLAYDVPKIDVVLLRGSYADEIGNISLEEEVAVLDATTMAMACKNNGGIVIVQVKDVVKSGTLDPRLVKIPASMVDVVVKTSNPFEYHRQVDQCVYSPFTPGIKIATESEFKTIGLDSKKVIARRAALFINDEDVVNLGIGMPEKITNVLNEEGQLYKITLTIESGLLGGSPLGGKMFGASINPHIIYEQDRQFDYYDGGGLDVTFLGLAQADRFGNINVSKFGTKIAGCGGFINISQNTKKVVFCGTFTTNGLKEEIVDGKLNIIQEGKIKKFLEDVEQITFSGKFANKTNQEVYYVTERAVFVLGKDGLILTEIAPGVDLKRDILEQMDFEPIVSKDLKLMDEKLFKDERINLVLSNKEVVCL